MNDISYIASFLQARDGFTIVSHVSPDGDTLGSALALYCALKKMGKRAQVICQNQVPAVYNFLPNANEVLLADSAGQMPNVICIDCAAKDRLGIAVRHFDAAEHTINIDHHRTNVGYANDNCIRDTAATGEIVFDLLEMLEMIDEDSASCLYTAIMTDTGNFAYANTTPDTLHKAAELLEDGADNAYINRCVYRTIPLRKAKLLGIALGKLEMYSNDRIGMICISAEDMKQAGATSEDVEGIIDHIRDIDMVELAIVARESSEPDTVKMSLRSKNTADVSVMAERMGGGGHKRAAGYTDHGAFAEVCARALAMAQEALEAPVTDS